MQNAGTTCITEDSEGRIWVGTMSNGFFNLNKETGQLKLFSREEGLPSNTVYGIVEGKKGELWLSTNNGLCSFNIENTSFKHYNQSNNLPHDQYNFASFYKDDEGTIYFGSIFGLAYFNPEQLTSNTNRPTVYLDQLKLFNKTINPTPDGTLTQPLDYTKQLTFLHKQNVITFAFSAIDLYSEGNNNFSYKLVGFDQDWNNIGSLKQATYTNLPFGHYTFLLKASNNDQLPSINIKELHIEILPPWYLKKVAFVLYFVTLALIMLMYLRFLQIRQNEKTPIQLEPLKKEKIKENKLKTQLTLIIASKDRLIQEVYSPEKNEKAYKLIKKNATRLHNLIDQLMSFRKIETTHEKLKLKKGDIVLFFKDTFDAFALLCEQKNINYRFTSEVTEFEAFFDADKFEKILTNILTNAIKHCEEMDIITLSVEVSMPSTNENPILTIKLSDTGAGIPPNVLTHIFEPFFTGSHSQSSYKGSGVGLALVKSLVAFMNGTIHINSEVGEGTTLQISIPLVVSNEILNVENIDGNKNLTIQKELIFDEEYNASSPIDDSSFTILIAEDNNDLLQFLSDYFSSKHYNVIIAENGAIAYEKANLTPPDLILSDVVMPEMDGIELCSKIKNSLNTSHIPVILLTAKDNVQNKLEALKTGADLYLNKPFNLNEVEILISNLLNSRNKLKKQFLATGNIHIESNSFIKKDKEFIHKLTKIVTDNIDNTEFDVTTFTREAGVSRSVLHVKLKKIANLSTSEFVKSIRIRRAAELLKQTELTISEISYQVGFSDPNYFSRSFKDVYDCTPSQFRSNL